MLFVGSQLKYASSDQRHLPTKITYDVLGQGTARTDYYGALPAYPGRNGRHIRYKLSIICLRSRLRRTLPPELLPQEITR